MRRTNRLLAVAGLLILGHAVPVAAALRVGVFQCDITPPLGQPMISGDLLQRVEHPLLAKGVVLEHGAQRFVLCSLDWCEVCNSTHTLFREKLAKAAGTSIAQVAVQTIHQHTAPLVDGDAAALLLQVENPPAQVDPKWIEAAADRLAAALKQALVKAEPFDQVGTGQAKVDRVAASRRVRAADGKILIRWSSCKDPALRAMPEGYFDPMLKTITLAESLASMNDPKRSYGLRTYRGALRVAFIQRIDQPIELSCLELGPVRVVHLPGEPMVAFQLYAQQLQPGRFVAVAGYGDCSPGYLCTAAAYKEGGYEPTDSMVAPEGEVAVKNAIDQLLGKQ